MPSAEKIKFVRKLHSKKYRQKYSQFLVEGEKITQEFINAGWSLDQIYIQREREDLTELYSSLQVELSSLKDLERMSAHHTAPPILAVFNMPKGNVSASVLKNTLILDNLNNPGNLGTIIRIADWYGIEQIIVGEQTVDEFNPKVIAASMGSSSRVSLYRHEMEGFIDSYEGEIFAAHMKGNGIHDLKKFEPPFALIMGSESHGVDPSLLALDKVKSITIERIGKAESLNVAVAAGIMLQGLTLNVK